jgi:putative ABC transport system permease protein
MFRFALKNLISRLVRTLLALCGLTVAIAGMVGLFSVAEGIEASVSATFAKVPGLAVMQPGAPIPLFSRIPASWGAEMARLEGVHVVHSEIWARANIIEGKPCFNPPRFLFGSDLEQADHLRYSVYREGLKEGRILAAADRGTLHTVVSRAIADQFHKKVGDTLSVDGLELEIVGIYQCNSLFLDVAIILDIELVRRLGRIGEDSVCAYYVEPDVNVDRGKLAQRIKDLFAGRSREIRQSQQDQPATNAEANPLRALLSAIGERPADGAQKQAGSVSLRSEADDESTAQESAVEVRDSDDWAREFKHFSEDLGIFLVLMTGIGVSIAFVGIVNTMLMSVTERFIEFGVLKANGWSNGDVLRLISFESGILGLGGGVTGCTFGWIATHAVNAYWPTRIYLHAGPQLLAGSVCFSIALGVLGGLYPAIRASRMMPMDAIRRG